MKIKFQDLRVLDENLRSDLMNDLKESFEDGKYIAGDAVKNIENIFSEFFSSPEAVFTSSGTSALIICLQSLGVSSGDEVIIPAMSWISTAHIVRELGATPVFCDITDRLLIDLDILEALITDKTKVIIPVHFGGLSCDMNRLIDISHKYSLSIIEDCSQAFGNKYNGRRLGTFGEFGCFSLNPMKIFGALGEAGLIISQSRHETIRSKIYCGVDSEKKILSAGINHRGDNLQARFLKTIFKYKDMKEKKVKELWKLYNDNLSDKVQLIGEGEDFIPYCVNILIENRDYIEKILNDNEIETKKIHLPLMSDISIYSSCVKSDENAQKIKSKLLTLPLHQYLNSDDVLKICHIINREII